MGRPKNLKTKVFLDGGDTSETREIINLLGFLDGQTTNPTLISKNPEVAKRLAEGKRFTEFEIYDFYKDVAQKIFELIPQGSISIEVYSDSTTSVNEILEQGKKMYSWIPNAWIKFPTTIKGLTAAERAVKERMRINMTLCFTQEQAAAVYSATKGGVKGSIYVSPFVGRLDDRGEDGMGLVADIIKMYKEGDGHVDVLTASARNLEHLLYAIYLGSDIVTAPFKVLKEWADKGLPLPQGNYRYDSGSLTKIPYEQLDLNKDWEDFDIFHELTQKGIERFSNDWNALIES